MTEKKDVPYIVYEDTATRLERTIERLWILAIILVALLIGTNGAWLYYEHQFEDITTTIQQDVETVSGNAIINDGVHYNGESETDNHNKETN